MRYPHPCFWLVLDNWLSIDYHKGMRKTKTRKIIKHTKKFTAKFLIGFVSKLLQIAGLLAIGNALGLHLVRY